jgi:exodeoxyribonuclease VII small subunit
MNKPFSFEVSYEKLEKILETLNEGKVPLEESLKLFEEANKLIQECDQYLNASQQKIETLIKNRQGTLELDENQKPVTKKIALPSNEALTE